MNELKIKEVIEKGIGKLIVGNENETIENIKMDSRQIEKGDTYIGLKGENTNRKHLL